MTVVELKHQAKLQEWQGKILECRSSGQSVSEWCRYQGITTTTYYRWEREIFGKAKESSQKQSMAMVPGEAVFVELPTPQEQCRTVAQQAATVRISGAEVDIYPGMEAELLKTLLKELKRC